MTSTGGDPAGELLARCAFPRAGAAVTCAVSGGADSLALLVLAARAGCAVTAVHVDHGLRPGSAGEADVVRAAAARFGAAFVAARADVRPGPNLEARARAARYAVLPEGVLTGHTADDQAETVLLHLLRGCGLDGLAALAGDPRRPLLALRRADTRALCATLGLTPVEDPSNADPAFVRNRVRHEVVPLLDDVAGRDVVPLLGRLATHAREAVAHLDADVAAAGLDVTDARALAAAPPALAHRAVRSWLAEIHPEGQPPEAAAVARVLAVARHEAVATEVAGGWRVARSRGRLRREPPPGREPPASANGSRGRGDGSPASADRSPGRSPSPPVGGDARSGRTGHVQ